jgi:hypothetical protein
MIYLMHHLYQRKRLKYLNGMQQYLVTGLTKADAVEINELSEKDGIKDEVLFEKHLLLKGLKDPQFDDLEQVEEFYSKATPSIVDKVLIGIYRCMAWTKEDQASIASEFPE